MPDPKALHIHHHTKLPHPLSLSKTYDFTKQSLALIFPDNAGLSGPSCWGCLSSLARSQLRVYATGADGAWQQIWTCAYRLRNVTAKFHQPAPPRVCYTTALSISSLLKWKTHSFPNTTSPDELQTPPSSHPQHTSSGILPLIPSHNERLPPRTSKAREQRCLTHAPPAAGPSGYFCFLKAEATQSQEAQVTP